MAESLYASTATKIVADRMDPPGTVETRQVETVDGDVMGSLTLFATSSDPKPRPSPGTTLTATVETIDNDMIGAWLFLEGAAGVGEATRSGPPGTRRTEAVETVDEDAARLFVLPGDDF
jgi:hypothetical protein